MKHLVVLVALVALLGLVHGLGGGTAGGGDGGAKRGTTGVSTRKSSAGGGSSGLSVSDNPTGTRNASVGIGVGAGGVDSGGTGVGTRTGALGGTDRGTSRGGGGEATGDTGRGAGESTVRGTSGGTGRRAGADSQARTSRGLSIGGSGFSSSRSNGPSSASTSASGLGSPVVGVVEGDASTPGGRRLSGNSLSGGLGFAGGVGANGDNNEDEDNGFFPSISSRGNSAFGRGGRFRGIVAGTTGFDSFGSPIAGRSIGGLGESVGSNAGGSEGLDEDVLFEEPSFRSLFDTSSGFHGNPTSRSNGFSRGSSGPREDFSLGSSERNWNGGAGRFGANTPGYGGFSIGGDDRFGSPASGFETPAGLQGGSGALRRSSDVEVGELPGGFTERGPGGLSAPEGSAGWPTSENFNDFERSGFGSSGGQSRPVANGPLGPVRSGVLHRIGQRRREGRGPFGHLHRLRKPDARLAAAIAAGTLVGAAAISSIGAGIAAAIRAGRTKGGAGLGGRRRLCLGRCRARQQRLNEGIKAAEDMFNSIPRGIERLY